jgi:hypothetical protein
MVANPSRHWDAYTVVVLRRGDSINAQART